MMLYITQNALSELVVRLLGRYELQALHIACLHLRLQVFEPSATPPELQRAVHDTSVFVQCVRRRG